MAERNVLVFGDLFRFGRAPDGSVTWHQRGNVRWLTRYVRAMLAAAPGIAVEGVEVEALGPLAEQCLPPAGADVERWWLQRSSAPLPRPLGAALRARVAGSVVIGFELPPSLRAHIRQHAALLIEIEIAPYRFMDDLIFRVSSSDRFVMAACAAVRLSERELHWQAGLLRAAMSQDESDWTGVGGNSVLLAAQTPFDRALMIENGFDRLDRHHDRLAQIAATHDVLLVRVHPHTPHHISGLAALLDIPNLRMTAANSYRLIANDRVAAVVSLSSSLLDEAPYFARPAIRLVSAVPQSDPAAVMVSPAALAGPPAVAIARACGVDLPEPEWRPTTTAGVLRDILGFDWARRDARGAGSILPAISLDSAEGRYAGADPRLQSGLVFGWYPPQDDRSWGAEVATLAVAWPATGDAAAIAFSLQLAGGGASTGIDTDVELWVAGERRASVTLAADGAPMSIEIVVERPANDLPIQIHVVTTAGMSNDSHRVLGVALMALTWRAIGHAHFAAEVKKAPARHKASKPARPRRPRAG